MFLSCLQLLFDRVSTQGDVFTQGQMLTAQMDRLRPSAKNLTAAGQRSLSAVVTVMTQSLSLSVIAANICPW